MKKKPPHIVTWAVLSLYLSLVFFFTILSREPSGVYRLELLPFKTVTDLFSVGYEGHGRYILHEVLVNIALLMPMGFLMSIRRKKYGLRKVAFWEGLTSLMIESLQLITKSGTFEVDDLIYNTFGCMIGYEIAWLIGRADNDI